MKENEGKQSKNKAYSKQFHQDPTHRIILTFQMTFDFISIPPQTESLLLIFTVADEEEKKSDTAM